jgi:hypothetical protein
VNENNDDQIMTLTPYFNVILCKGVRALELALNLSLRRAGIFFLSRELMNV